MHPLKERLCDAILEHPLLQTPPPEPEIPKPPKIKIPKEFKIAPRFPLMSKEQYTRWVNHRKEIRNAKPKLDAKPPALFPELYLKPRRLDYYAKQLEANMNVNKELLKKINLIQRTGGFVDCWMRPEPNNKLNKVMLLHRRRQLDALQTKNLYLHSRILNARSEQLQTKELDEEWEETKNKLILGASLPFILFKTDKIDRDIRDPAFDKPPNVIRGKVQMDVRVYRGSKIGRVIIELFNDVVPKTCQLFMSLLKGDRRGYAYKGTRIFRIVPGLYCVGGDVDKDNGFGMYCREDADQYMRPENFQLNHTVPGVLSMVVTKDKEVTGQFNIIFKPLPQFDGKHVVFGRIVAGPAQFLERISALGLPLGSTNSDVLLAHAGWLTRRGQLRDGAANTRRFPRHHAAHAPAAPDPAAPDPAPAAAATAAPNL